MHAHSDMDVTLMVFYMLGCGFENRFVCTEQWPSLPECNSCVSALVHHNICSDYFSPSATLF